MSDEPSAPAVVVEYVRIQSLLEGNDQNAVEKFRNDMSLEFQGEAVELSEDMPLLSALFAFGIAYEVADEAILRQADGQAILLFDHQSKNVIRPHGVNEIIWEEISKVKKKIVSVENVGGPIPEIIVNLETVWAKMTDADALTRTEQFIKELKNVFSPALRLVIQGTIPHLALLSALYVARSSGREVYYEDIQGKQIAIFH